MNSEHNWKWQAIVDSCDCSSRSCHHDPHNWMTASWNCWVALWTSAQACSALPPNPYSHLEAPTRIFLLSQSEVSCKDSSSSSVMHGLHEFSLSPQSKSIRSWSSSTKTRTKNIKQAPKTKTLALTVNAKFHSLSLKFWLLIWLWPLIQSHVYILCKSMIYRKGDSLVPFIFRCNANKKKSTEQVLDSFIVALHVANFARFWKSASSKLWTQHNKKCSSFVVVVVAVAPHFPLPNFLVGSSCMRNSFMATKSI